MILSVSPLVSQGSFFRQYWAEFDPAISNHKDNRWRVNDAELSLHENFGNRPEARANGLMLINVPEDLFLLQKSEIYLEMWGGHPGTANKRFILNGKKIYFIREEGAEANNCTYSYPTIPFEISHMVNGLNAIQFACDRGNTFWGHFIIDNASVNCYLKPDHPDIQKADLNHFYANVTVDNRLLGDETTILLSYPPAADNQIQAVEYFGNYFDYDDNGNLQEQDWHGFTYSKEFTNHIGKSTNSPFQIEWDTSMIPEQGKTISIQALVHFKNGLKFWTPILSDLEFVSTRNPVKLYGCADLPTPFWSRASREKKAKIMLPEDLSKLEKAQLIVKVWDGGEGDVKEPFTINGYPYNIVSGKHIHDIVFSKIDVDGNHLRAGENIIRLLSDTEHHGIEILLPGPALICRFKK